MTDHFVESTFFQQDETFELSMRPKSLDDFEGQEPLRRQLEILMGAALKRSEPIGHCLFSGPPGLGKTTLSHIIAHHMGANIIITSGPILEKPGDLAGILTKLHEGDILFIDEIHRMQKNIEEYLYSAMEDFALDLVVDSGINSKSVRLKLNKFTLIGATTRLGLLSAPLRSRFVSLCRLDYYDASIIGKILRRTSSLLQIKADQPGLHEIAKRSRGTPRIANNLLRWARDYVQMHESEKLDLTSAIKALQMLSIDEKGLDELDKKILEVIIDHHQGGPVGIKALAVAVGEEPHTIEEVHEPFLVMQGLIARTPRGRVATHIAYEHLGRKLS